MTKREKFNEAFAKLIREEEDIYEAHWREKIAKEIEDNFDPKSSAEIVIAIRNRCAAIARGQK